MQPQTGRCVNLSVWLSANLKLNFACSFWSIQVALYVSGIHVRNSWVKHFQGTPCDLDFAKTRCSQSFHQRVIKTTTKKTKSVQCFLVVSFRPPPRRTSLPRYSTPHWRPGSRPPVMYIHHMTCGLLPISENLLSYLIQDNVHKFQWFSSYQISNKLT